MRAATAVAEEAPGVPMAQAVGRRQGLRIELHAGVGEARVHRCHLLEQVVVGGRDDPRPRVGQCLQHRLGQGGALGGIGSHAHLVECDQAPLAGRLDDAGEVRHVGGEGRETLPDVLLVPDVGEDRLRCVHLRTGGGRYVKTGPREERREAQRLHRHRLAAGIGTREHQHREALTQVQVVGNRLRDGEERVPELVQQVHAVFPERGLHRLHLPGELAPGKGEIDDLQHLQVRLDRRTGLGRPLGERAQHPPRLPLDGELGLLEPIVEIDHRLRFHEERGSGGGGVVHDAGDPPPGIGADRQYVAVVADGEERIR